MAEKPVGFATEIQSLFREKDRQSMRLHFDLGSYEDVSTYADRILDRVRRGSMPCDGTWPPKKIELFERWIRTGMKP
jgi:hypothetical protein